MIIKVCGLTQTTQIEKLDQIESIDWLGSIFYKKSKRGVDNVRGEINNSKSAGVFVNEEMVQVLEIAEINRLDILQLHGNESPEYCSDLKENFTVVKAFGVDETFDFNSLAVYQNTVDYFLFDTKTADHGGSGKIFNWDLLRTYKLSTPFILSGGINPDSVESILNFVHPSFAGIDINSGFELEPGNKNIELIEKFISELTREK